MGAVVSTCDPNDACAHSFLLFEDRSRFAAFSALSSSERVGAQVISCRFPGASSLALIALRRGRIKRAEPQHRPCLAFGT